MAKSKSFFGLRRGSTKTLTFQVNNGKQITKDRVYEVKNPRTQEQMVQRMVMATASAAYAHMKQIVDHSFEGITYGQMNMSEFIRLNAKKLRDNLGAAEPVMAYNNYQDRSLVPGAYIMSSGTAPDFSSKPWIHGDVVDDTSYPEVMVSVSQQATLNADTLFAKYGWTLNDLCTCIIVSWDSSASKWKFAFIRFTPVKGGTTALTTDNLAEYLKIESNEALTIAIAGNGITVKLGYGDSDEAGMATCVIHSAKTANGWTRNNTVLNVAGIAENFLNPTESDAIATYPVGGSYVLNGGEVNG